MVTGIVMELENAAPEIKQIAIEREENDADMDDEVRIHHSPAPVPFFLLFIFFCSFTDAQPMTSP